MENKLDNQLLLLGRSISIANANRTDAIINNIHEAEFKVFSQWGDDGIIDFLVSYLDIKGKIFVEFGVENYTEANTRFLLMNRNWEGLIMDGSVNNMEYVKRDPIFWRFNLKAVPAFVTVENINTLLQTNGISGEIGLLHIDIDGNDYWVWEKINVVNPVIVIVEYNSVFGPDQPWTVPYDPGFVRTQQHHSNLYYGTSLAAICSLGDKKGYSFIGCNSNGNNAYFVRNDRLRELRKKTSREGYVLSQFRESRSSDGKLTFKNGESRLKEIEGMPVYNIATSQIEKITV